MEDANPIKKTVVVYVGRFQPMHKGHAGTYQHLVKKFGKDNVYVGTSDKVQLPKSPFNFKEKVKIMTTMFGIPKSKIHKVKNPYKPTEILKKFDEETTAFVTVVGEKDKNRLGGKYFQPYKGEPSVGYRDGGYVYAAPMTGGSVSGTEVRNGLSVGSDEQKKNFFKKRAYGKFNATIFSMITDKLDEGIEISKEMIEEWLLNEGSKMGSGQADDGPNFMFPNYDVFSKINVDRAKRIGYEVVNMITNKELEDYYDHPTYPNGPVKAVTPFPAGVLGTTTATNQVDIYSSDAYSKWFKHVTRKAALVGYELVKGLDTNKDEKEQSLDSQKGDKKSQEEYEASLNENIVLPIKVGDTIMTGRFKNKKTVVKSIGKDEHGMPTINGRKVVTFRMVKEGFISELAGTEVKCEKCNHQWEIESDDSEKYLCHSCGWDSQKGEYDFDAFDSWQEKMGISEDVDVEESKGRLRPAALLRRKAAMAGKRAQIARRRARTMKRRKPLSKLKKIAYKKAYLQVYDEFMKDLFPGKKKNELSIAQAKVVHKNVLRKKGRVRKRAKFRFLPALRDAEVQKFGKKDDTNELMIGYAGPEDMKRFDKRNKEYRKDSDSNKEYQYDTIKEVNEFFYMDFKKYVYKNRKQINQKLKGLSYRKKAEFLELLWKKQVGKGFGKDADGRDIHYKLKSDKVIKESLPTKVTDKFKSVKSSKPSSEAEKDFNKHHTYSSYAKRGSIAEPDTIDFDDDDKKGGHQEKEKDTKKRGYEPIEESLKDLGIKDFKSLFKKMPSDLQKRVYNLKNFGQRVDKHPEGNVLKHTIVVVNRSIKEDDIDIAIAAMFHDIGKDETAGIHPKKGHITHFGHEKVSASLVKKYKKFIESVGGNPANVFYIVKNHMRYKQLSVMTPKKVNKLKSFRAFDKLGKFSKHDRSGLDENKATRTKFSLSVPSDIKKLQKAFKKNKKQLYVVGGAVRDALMGNSPKDFDLTTDATPEEMIKIAKQGNFKHSTNNVNSNLGLGSIIINGHEVTTFREDIGKGRRPDKVKWCDISTDSKRRDLTCNSLYYDIDKKEIIDFHGGVEDLKKGVVKTVGKASERFDEDPLRKLRAVRFETRLGGKLDKETLTALKKDNNISQLSGERIMREFRSAIKQSKNTKVYLERCDEIGFTKQILPGLKVSKPYPHDNNYLTFIAFILRDNDPSKVGNVLNKINYSNNDKDDITFLISLKDFTPEKIIQFKKQHENVKSISDKDILEFGKRIGKKLDKFVKFKLSVKGSDIPKDIPNGPERGNWIKNQEKEKFMNEIEQLISDIDNKIVEMFLPNTKTPQQLIKENINETKLLQEGGAYGHMSHPFDTDINLTFGQLKDIVNRALEGTLEFTREKTDGQALAISWRDGRLVAARNKGHLKNKGENALDIKGVSDKFQGRGGLSDAYNYAMKDLSNAIKSLSDKQRDKIFKQGACFMNLEVIYPTSVNVIPYGQALLVFHGTMEFNMDGVAIGENGDAARILAGMIKQVNKDVQDNYTIQGPPIVKLPKSQDLSTKRSKYSSMISKLQSEFSLKDTDGVANYHQSWWEQWVDKNSPSSLDNKTKMGLVKRWAFMDKKFRLDKKNITDEKTLEWAKKIDKEDQKKISKKNLMKFEQIFLGLGAEVLEFTSSALTVNADGAVRDMKKRIDKTIKDVKKSGDPKKIEKLKLELGRLKSIGGSKKIVPNEGIVFLYKGNTFKLTGTFASVNQILGIFF
jgi:tRNA nucleotidyltransferase/poly(A) polymerase/Zn finger protein HypA/HybF involved in hydrogenase expression